MINQWFDNKKISQQCLHACHKQRYIVVFQNTDDDDENGDDDSIITRDPDSGRKFDAVRFCA